MLPEDILVQSHDRSRGRHVRFAVEGECRAELLVTGTVSLLFFLPNTSLVLPSSSGTIPLLDEEAVNHAFTFIDDFKFVA